MCHPPSFIEELTGLIIQNDVIYRIIFSLVFIFDVSSCKTLIWTMCYDCISSYVIFVVWLICTCVVWITTTPPGMSGYLCAVFEQEEKAEQFETGASFFPISRYP